jgi:hypothetical protein
MTENRLTCADCDELFLDYFEGDLDAATRTSIDAHIGSCARCQGLVRDIAGIRNQASALQDIAPSKDLWQGIEARIQPAVVSIAPHRQAFGLQRRMLVAAAAALVVVTSSVTYVTTSRVIGKGQRPVRVVENPRAVPLPGETDEVGTSAVPGVDEGSSPSATVESAPAEAPVRAAEPKATQRIRQTEPRTALVSKSTAPMTASEMALSSEIGQLQTLLRQKRTELDPATVQVVEDNLNLIDVAVKQARAALARDPASGFLTERLDNALQKKVELLRTVAMLPSKS